MTTVRVLAADLRRPVSPDMFADVIEAEPAFAAVGGLFEVSFTVVLDDGQARTVRDRLLTCSPQHEAGRVALRVLRDDANEGGIDEIRAAVVGAIDHLLGESEGTTP